MCESLRHFLKTSKTFNTEQHAAAKTPTTETRRHRENNGEDKKIKRKHENTEATERDSMEVKKRSKIQPTTRKGRRRNTA
jgi:hypothetical protein